MVEDAGFTPLEATRSATTVAADLMGQEGRVGRLEVGAWADLIAVRGDPLDDVSTLLEVKLVMKGGEIVTDAR